MSQDREIVSDEEKQQPSKILFDGNCIVCDYEISHYKRLYPREFELLDISAPEFEAKNLGLTTEMVQKHMHVITPKGEILTGVDAFAHIWSRTARYSWAPALIKLPGVYSLAKIGYDIFARNRHLLPKKNRS